LFFLDCLTTLSDTVCLRNCRASLRSRTEAIAQRCTLRPGPFIVAFAHTTPLIYFLLSLTPFHVRVFASLFSFWLYFRVLMSTQTYDLSTCSFLSSRDGPYSALTEKGNLMQCVGAAKAIIHHPCAWSPRACPQILPS
jgi:hypothetical protein